MELPSYSSLSLIGCCLGYGCIEIRQMKSLILDPQQLEDSYIIEDSIKFDSRTP